MKAPKHLPNTTEMKTCRNAFKAHHIKSLNDLTSYSGQIFKQNPLFFIIQDCVNQRKALFYLRSCLATSFFSLIKAQFSAPVKLNKFR